MQNNSQNQEEFQEGNGFDDWFERNRDQIVKLLHNNDAEKLLYEAWFSGYTNGMNDLNNLFPKRSLSGKK